MINLFKKKNTNNNVVTRIAPSPTGNLHIGTARAALFNYLFTKQNNGKFILRIEDTDKERNKKEFEDSILNGLDWLGLEYDEFYRQSNRTKIYKKYLEKLVKVNKAYISKEEKGGRSEVIRFKNPNTEIVFSDEIRGEVRFDTTELGDFVIAKSMSEPLYHLAVVIDDHEMGITHVIRGEDGISNTPRQILIQQAIGAKTPIYAHLPLVLGKDKSKLSKRHGATSISEYKTIGYLKEALLNQLAFLGWNPGDEREIFTIDELIKEFSLEKVSKSGAVFNLEKLDWFNKEHLTKLPEKEILKNIDQKLKRFNPDKNLLKKLIPVVLERINKWSDIDLLIEEGEFNYYFNAPDYDSEKLIWKNSSKEKTIVNLEKVRELISDLGENPDSEEVKNSVWDYAEEQGKGDVLWPTRYALSGAEKSPDPFTLISILGIKKSIDRINKAIEKLNV